MTDFWFSITWSVVLGLVTGCADSLVCRLVAYRRYKTATKLVLMGEQASEEKVEKALEELGRTERVIASGPIWGVEMATVSLGMNLSALSLWLSGRNSFPILEQWNSAGVDRTLYAWLLVVVLNLLLVFVSMSLKHMHADRVETSRADVQAMTQHPLKWLQQSVFMLIGNLVGFMAVFGAFLVITSPS